MVAPRQRPAAMIYLPPDWVGRHPPGAWFAWPAPAL